MFYPFVGHHFSSSDLLFAPHLSLLQEVYLPARSQRLSKLLALLSLAIAWALRSGQWLHQAKPLPLKSHGRRAKSLFRYGLDYLRSIVLNLDHKFEQFLEAVQFLSCT